MTYLTHFSLQQSIYTILTADSTLNGLITGIFDHVPQGTEYPFVTLGESAIRDFSNVEKQGTEAMLTLRIFSREAGRKEAAIIMERIVSLLHNVNHTVEGQSLVSIQYQSSNIMLEDDGATYRGTLIFKARMLEE